MKEIAIIGLGNRGSVYAKYMNESDKVKIVSVCDVLSESLLQAKELYNVKEENLFLDENEFFKEKRADILIVATMDELHCRQTLRALELGYDVLLEKPVSPNYEECKQIAECAKRTGRKVVICHNLRYTPFYQCIKRLVVEGAIGDVVSFEQSENVGFGHYICSFVRGKWHRQEETSPIILQKCCHDLDIMYWIIGKKCEKLFSSGSLSFYTEKNAPQNSTSGCGDCPVKNCRYNANDLYITFPGSMNVPYGFDKSEENIRRYVADKNNQYGKCVFRFDNDVCDRQTVNMQFEDGVTGTLFMHGFGVDPTYRLTTVYGTKGVISGRLEDNLVRLETYDGKVTEYDVAKLIKDGGHSGGDIGLSLDVIDYFVDGKQALGISFVEDSVYSHKLAFCAEESRLSGEWVKPGREL